jgi:hypothetical protein
VTSRPVNEATPKIIPGATSITGIALSNEEVGENAHRAA